MLDQIIRITIFFLRFIRNITYFLFVLIVLNVFKWFYMSINKKMCVIIVWFAFVLCRFKKYHQKRCLKKMYSIYVMENFQKKQK